MSKSFLFNLDRERRFIQECPAGSDYRAIEIHVNTHPNPWLPHTVVVRSVAMDSDTMADEIALHGEALDYVAELAASRASQWVKCSEHTPEPFAPLWCCERGKVVEAYYEPRADGGKFINAKSGRVIDTDEWHPDTRPAAPERGE